MKRFQIWDHVVLPVATSQLWLSQPMTQSMPSRPDLWIIRRWAWLSHWLRQTKIAMSALRHHVISYLENASCPGVSINVIFFASCFSTLSASALRYLQGWFDSTNALCDFHMFLAQCLFFELRLERVVCRDPRVPKHNHWRLAEYVEVGICVFFDFCWHRHKFSNC